jgi:predicted porin
MPFNNKWRQLGCRLAQSLLLFTGVFVLLSWRFLMKKNLIALAVLAASGVASAQSNVTLYGLVDAYIGNQKINGQSQTGVNLSSPAGGSGGGLNTSRFGLKGSEELGGGLKANFVLEAGFDPSTGVADNYKSPYTGTTSSAIFGRQSWVGLSGGFGEVRLGKMWTPFDEVKGSSAAAFDANIFAPAANVWASNGYSDRPGNSVYYVTPSFGGVTAAAMYSFGENKTPTVSAGKIGAVNIAYAGGPIAAALSYQTEKATGSTTATQFTQLNASYDFGIVKLLGAYGRVKDGLNPYGFAVAKSNEYQIGLDFPVNSVLTLSGGYAHSKDTQYAGGPDITRKGLGLAGLYALSKRTNLYAGVQDSKQDGYATTSENKIRIYAVGVRHTF